MQEQAQEYPPLDTTNGYGPGAAQQYPEANNNSDSDVDLEDTAPYEELRFTAIKERHLVQEGNTQHAFLDEWIMEEQDIAEDYFNIDDNGQMPTMVA